MSAEPVTIELTRDQALVLFEFLARFQETNELAFAHVAEFRALNRIGAQLDTALVEMFCPDYRELLDSARARVAEGWEGDFPGPKVETT